MKEVKQTAEYTIFAKKSGRYAVKGKNKKWVNGEEKSRILLAESMIKPPMTKAPVVEAPAAEESTDAPTEGEA